MASPQVEHGHVRIANELWDALTRCRIPGEQRQVLDAIIRRTYGCGKKRDQISLGQIAKMTGLKRQNVQRALSALSSKLITAVIKTDDRKPQEIGINKNYEEWAPPLSSKLITPPVLKSDDSAVLKSDDSAVLKSDDSAVLKSDDSAVLKSDDSTYHIKEKYIPPPTPPADQKPEKQTGPPPCPHDRIVEIYHATCPELPRVRKLTQPLRDSLRARWREYAERQDLDWWQGYFADVSKSDFLMGRVKEWSATLAWLIGPKNMTKVLNGHYENRNGNGRQPRRSGRPDGLSETHVTWCHGLLEEGAVDAFRAYCRDHNIDPEDYRHAKPATQ